MNTFYKRIMLLCGVVGLVASQPAFCVLKEDGLEDENVLKEYEASRKKFKDLALELYLQAPVKDATYFIIHSATGCEKHEPPVKTQKIDCKDCPEHENVKHDKIFQIITFYNKSGKKIHTDDLTQFVIKLKKGKEALCSYALKRLDKPKLLK